MHNIEPLQCREFAFASAEYREAVGLREALLRRPLSQPWSERDFDGEEQSFHLGAFRGDRLVGVLILRPREDATLQMRQVAVAPDEQRHGVGSTLVRYAEQFAAARGYTAIMAHARESAEEFYRKLHYRITDHRFQEIGIPHVLISKELCNGSGG